MGIEAHQLPVAFASGPHQADFQIAQSSSPCTNDRHLSAVFRLRNEVYLWQQPHLALCTVLSATACQLESLYTAAAVATSDANQTANQLQLGRDR